MLLRLLQNRNYLFRLLTIVAIVIHFLPSFLAFRENYIDAELRFDLINHFLFVYGNMLPLWLKAVAAILLGIVVILLFFEKIPRILFILCGVILYFFLGINALNTNAFFIPILFYLLIIFAARPMGERPFSLRVFSREIVIYPFRYLLLFTLLSSVIISGIEKINGGWFTKVIMELLLSYPPQTYLRDWVYATFLYKNTFYGTLGSYLAPLIEIIAPVLMIIPKTRKWGLIIYTLFFTATFAMMRIPTAFIIIYLSVVILVPSESQWQNFLQSCQNFLRKKSAKNNRRFPVKLSLFGATVTILFFGIQTFMATRHWFITGDVQVTREGEWFSWRVMSEQAHECHFALYDLENKKIKQETPRQLEHQMAAEPYLIYRMAQQACQQQMKMTDHRSEFFVRADALCRMNAFDDPIFIIHPEINLCKISYKYLEHNDFIFKNYIDAQKFSRQHNPLPLFENLKPKRNMKK